MDPIDGNGIAGLLIDAFGKEMTAVSSTCATCGARRPVAELVVYQRAPGTVVRCRTCGNVVMVLVRRGDSVDVDLSGLANLSNQGLPYPTGTQVANKEGINMSDEQSMSRGQPDEESMSMGQPDEESMSMGQPDEGSMSMGQPDQESMSMGQPDEESMSMGQPDKDPM
jgi:Family of unknown function (DUF6510)